MQCLTASHCRLRTVEIVPGSELMIVDLSWNRLVCLPRFDSQKLHTLIVKHNFIQILDRSLLNYPLRRLEMQNNRLRTFYMRALHMEYVEDTEIKQFVDVGSVRLPLESYQSL
jgi:hypothetical protein